MAASHQSVSATGQQVARDLAPLIPGLPAPPLGGAQSDPRVWVPLPSLPWAGPQKGGVAGGIPKTWPFPTLAWGECAWGCGQGPGRRSHLIGFCFHPGISPGISQPPCWISERRTKSESSCELNNNPVEVKGEQAEGSTREGACGDFRALRLGFVPSGTGFICLLLSQPTSPYR